MQSHGVPDAGLVCRPCSTITGEQTVYAVTGSPEDVILYRGAGGVVPHGWPGDQTCANSSLCVLTTSSRNTGNDSRYS